MYIFAFKSLSTGSETSKIKFRRVSEPAGSDSETCRILRGLITCPISSLSEVLKTKLLLDEETTHGLGTHIFWGSLTTENLRSSKFRPQKVPDLQMALQGYTAQGMM